MFDRCSFTWGELKKWAERQGYRISSDPLNPPSCQFIGCSMNEEEGGHFQDRHRIRLWKVEHEVPVKMLSGKVVRQKRVDFVICCAAHEWHLPSGCTVTPVDGAPDQIFQLAAEILRFQFFERAISNAARHPKNGMVRRSRPADIARRNERRALR